MFADSPTQTITFCVKLKAVDGPKQKFGGY